MGFLLLSTGPVDCDLAYGDNGECRCAWCGDALPQGRTRWCSGKCADAFASNHYWKLARRAAVKRDHRRCVKCASRVLIEVNHKVPVLGRHAEGGCRHHLEGLQTLCHQCHVEETRRQFGHRDPAGRVGDER